MYRTLKLFKLFLITALLSSCGQYRAKNFSEAFQTNDRQKIDDAINYVDGNVNKLYTSTRHVDGKTTLVHTVIAPSDYAPGKGIVHLLEKQGRRLLRFEGSLFKEVNVTPELQQQAIDDYIPRVEEILQRGANINVKDSEGKTPMHEVIISMPNIKYWRYLISKGVNINAKDNKGRTLLHIAVQHRPNTEYWSLLLANGAKINAKDNDGNTPLVYLLRQAMNKKNTPGYQQLDFLINNNADVNALNNILQPVSSAALSFRPDYPRFSQALHRPQVEGIKTALAKMHSSGADFSLIDKNGNNVADSFRLWKQQKLAEAKDEENQRRADKSDSNWFGAVLAGAAQMSLGKSAGLDTNTIANNAASTMFMIGAEGKTEDKQKALNTYNEYMKPDPSIVQMNQRNQQLQNHKRQQDAKQAQSSVSGTVTLDSSKQDMMNRIAALEAQAKAQNALTTSTSGETPPKTSGSSGTNTNNLIHVPISLKLVHRAVHYQGRTKGEVFSIMIKDAERQAPITLQNHCFHKTANYCSAKLDLQGIDFGGIISKKDDPSLVLNAQYALPHTVNGVCSYDPSDAGCAKNYSEGTDSTEGVEN